MKRVIMMFLGALLLYMTACDGDDPSSDYFEYSYIDTVLAADTIPNNALVQVVYVYPGGCNSFERIESSERGDTLELAALIHFHFEGSPCAHGSGLDTTSYCLQFSEMGDHYLLYRQSEITKIVQPVYVEE